MVLGRNRFKLVAPVGAHGEGVALARLQALHGILHRRIRARPIGDVHLVARPEVHRYLDVVGRHGQVAYIGLGLSVEYLRELGLLHLNPLAALEAVDLYIVHGVARGGLHQLHYIHPFARKQAVHGAGLVAMGVGCAAQRAGGVGVDAVELLEQHLHRNIVGGHGERMRIGITRKAANLSTINL